MQNEKKILLIGRASKNIGGIATGGVSKHIEDLSKKLLKKDIEPCIWDFRLKRTYKNSGIHIVGVSLFYKIVGIFYAIFYLQILWSRKYQYLSIRDKIIVSVQAYKLKKTVYRLNIETIHIHSLNRPITGFLRQKFPTINIVITDHGFWNKVKNKQQTNHKVFRNISINIDVADKVIVISKYGIEKFKEYNLPLNKTVLIPNPIFISQIPIKKQNENKKIIFFNGYNKSIQIKNLRKVVEALKTDSFFDNYKLIAIVNEKGKEYIKNQNFNFRVEILGAQSWDTIVELYNKSKILVVPSKSESFGLVYLEALAVGIPIIGFHKTVEEFKETLNIDIGETFNEEEESAKDLAVKIKTTLFKDYNSMILRNAVEETYDWEYKIIDFVRLYKF